MLLHVPHVLTPDELHRARQWLADAPWIDGLATAGTQAAHVKRNQQLPQQHPTTQALQDLVLGALERHKLFFSAALPKRVVPPLFNRYAGEANTYGNHVDNAVRIDARTQIRVRADVSCTLFLTDPTDYDGGDLVVEDTYGHKRVKLPAGDLILYPGTSVHRVEPVTRGARVGCFFWVESMVRLDEQRRLLFDLDMNLMRLRDERGSTEAESDPAVALTGTYHNLLRMWADT